MGGCGTREEEKDEKRRQEKEIDEKRRVEKIRVENTRQGQSKIRGVQR